MLHWISHFFLFDFRRHHYVRVLHQLSTLLLFIYQIKINYFVYEFV